MLRDALAFLPALAALMTTGVAGAADHVAIAPYLTGDVVDVACINLEKVDLPAIHAHLAKWKVLPQSQQEEARKEVAELQAKLAELPKHGARRAYALVRMRDLFEGGPVWLIELQEQNQAQAVIDVLKPWIENSDHLGDAAMFLPKVVAADGKFVVAAASQERLTALTKRQGAMPRPDILEALAATGENDVALVMVGDPESRRVIREMFPQFPAPFSEIDGKLLVEGLKSISINMKLPPEPTITIGLDTTGNDLATRLEQSFEKAQLIAKGAMVVELTSGPPAHKRQALEILPLLPKLAFQKEQGRLTFTFGDDQEEKTFLENMLPVFAQQARTKAQLTQRLDQFKTLALGMYNYNGQKGSFPARALFDKNGRPLLSWRVALLPYLDQQALYNEFHLDEPWDSEHNRRLIEKMPQVYADPDPEVRAAIERGRTTYVLPIGEKLLFHDAVAPKLSEIKDDAGMTVLVIEVVPERAVVWTKPDDWDVDLDNPLNGVKREDRELFTAARADGSARHYSTSVDPKAFAASLTPAGGEEVSPP